MIVIAYFLLLILHIPSSYEYQHYFKGLGFVLLAGQAITSVSIIPLFYGVHINDLILNLHRILEYKKTKIVKIS